MLKKVIFAFILAALLIVSFHKSIAAPHNSTEFFSTTAAADDSPTLGLAELPDEAAFGSALTCETLAGDLAAYPARLAESRRVLQEFLQQAAARYTDWHRALSAFEEKSATWNEAIWAGLIASVTTLELSSKKIYAVSEARNEEAAKIRAAVESCLPDSATRTQALEAFDAYLVTSDEHLSTLAGFVSQMRTSLRGPLQAWLTKAKAEPGHAVPLGYFAVLKKGADTFSEATALTSENALYVEAQFAAFLKAQGHSKAN